MFLLCSCFAWSFSVPWVFGLLLSLFCFCCCCWGGGWSSFVCVQSAGRTEPTWTVFSELVEWDAAMKSAGALYLANGSGPPIEPPAVLPRGILKAREYVFAIRACVSPPLPPPPSRHRHGHQSYRRRRRLPLHACVEGWPRHMNDLLVFLFSTCGCK